MSNLKTQTLLNVVFTIIMVTLLVNIAEVLPRTLTTSSSTYGIDFHAYWYAGHFVRQLRDPYTAWFLGEEPNLPVTYLDGATVRDQSIAQPGLSQTPANTAPIVLLLSPLSLFSWSTAHTIWNWLNISFVFIIPWMIIWYMQKQKWLVTKWTKWLNISIVLTFLSLGPMEVVIHTGQTSLLVLLLMLISLLTKNWIVSGISLGVALSKYSLSIPVFIFFVLKRKYREITLSIFVQIFALILLSFLTRVPIFNIIDAYRAIFNNHIGFPGIHLAYYTNWFGSHITLLVLLIFTFVVALPVLVWLKRYYCKMQDRHLPFIDLHIISVIMLYILLIGYHRHYDLVVWILPFAVLSYGIASNIWDLSSGWKLLLSLTLLFSWLFLCVHGYTYSFFRAILVLPEDLEFQFQYTVTTLLNLAWMIVLLYRYSSLYAERSQSQ